MTSIIIRKLRAEGVDKEKGKFKIGDSIKVHVNIVEGGKERIQLFAGTVIARDGTGSTETFTVRKISHGVGVERVFPVQSPFIKKIEVDSSADVRRAKLYYMRDLTGKRAKLKTSRS